MNNEMSWKEWQDLEKRTQKALEAASWDEGRKKKCRAAIRKLYRVGELKVGEFSPDTMDDLHRALRRMRNLEAEGFSRRQAMERAMSEAEGNGEAEGKKLSAKVSDSAMREAIRAAVANLGWASSYHLKIEIARILGLGRVCPSSMQEMRPGFAPKGPQEGHAAKELNELWMMLQPMIVTVVTGAGHFSVDQRQREPGLEKEFTEKLIEERAKHPPGTWRKWIKDHCLFTEAQVRPRIRDYEQGTNRSLIWAENAGRQSLAWEQVKDRIEPLWSQILEIVSAIDPEDRTDAECALMDFVNESLIRRKV